MRRGEKSSFILGWVYICIDFYLYVLIQYVFFSLPACFFISRMDSFFDIIINTILRRDDHVSFILGRVYIGIDFYL